MMVGHSSSLSVLSTGELAGHPVRFLKPPAMPDWPWVRWADVLDATGASDIDRISYTAVLFSAWKEKIHVDQDGNVSIPENLLGGFVLTMIERKKLPASALIKLHGAGKIAIDKLTSCMSRHERDSYKLAMSMRGEKCNA